MSEPDIENYIKESLQKSAKHYILVSLMCNEIDQIHKLFNAQIININYTNKSYLSFTSNGKYFSIWSNFDGNDDEYLLEFRKFCHRIEDLPDIRFYIPSHPYFCDAFSINKQFLKIFKKGSYKICTYVSSDNKKFTTGLNSLL